MARDGLHIDGNPSHYLDMSPPATAQEGKTAGFTVNYKFRVACGRPLDNPIENKCFAVRSESVPR